MKVSPDGPSAVHPSARRRLPPAASLSVLALALAAGAAVLFLLRPDPGPGCATAAASGADDAAVVSACRREYERAGSPLAGVRLADVLRRSGDVPAARVLAVELLGTPVRGDALRVLAEVAIDHGATSSVESADDAARLLEEAREVHRARGDPAGAARDDEARARLLGARRRYAEALRAVEECLAEARAAADGLVEGRCHLSAALLLGRVGYSEASHQELDRAAEELGSDREVAQLWRARGELERGTGHDGQAVFAFQRGAQYARRAGDPAVLASLRLALADSLADVGRLAEAERILGEASAPDPAPDPAGDLASPRLRIAARIALDRGDLRLAAALVDRAYPLADGDDSQIELCALRARVALAAGDPAAAVEWARRGADRAEHARAQELELRPWVAARRREPLELLFVALARSARLDEAVLVFDQWQARARLDELARPVPDPGQTPSAAARSIQDLERWIPAASKTALLSIGEGAAPRALPAVDLIGLAAADGRLWRVTLARGRPSVDDLGRLDALRERLDRFSANPTNAASAEDLGRLVLPDVVVRADDDPLYAVLGAPLWALPIGALRRDGRLLIETRPVLLSPRLPSSTVCEPVRQGQGVVLLADAPGEFPEARRESARIATLFGTTPLVGPAATSAMLFAAGSDRLLHLAVRVEVGTGGGVLQLHDRPVAAAEIAASRLGPAIVVLSGSDLGRAWEPGLSNSVSTALLSAGSRRVVTALRPTSGRESLEVTRRFYDEGGIEGPAQATRVLARVQARLARTDDAEWPAFAVFGSCRESDREARRASVDGSR